MQKICSRLLGLKQVSFQHINKVIAHKMANLLTPAQGHQYGQTNHLGVCLYSYVHILYFTLLIGVRKYVPGKFDNTAQYIIYYIM